MGRLSNMGVNPNSFNDFRGTPLKVGDKVVTSTATGVLCFKKVVRITAAGVWLDEESAPKLAMGTLARTNKIYKVF